MASLLEPVCRCSPTKVVGELSVFYGFLRGEHQPAPVFRKLPLRFGDAGARARRVLGSLVPEGLSAVRGLARAASEGDFSPAAPSNPLAGHLRGRNDAQLRSRRGPRRHRDGAKPPGSSERCPLYTRSAGKRRWLPLPRTAARAGLPDYVGGSELGSRGRRERSREGTEAAVTVDDETVSRRHALVRVAADGAPWKISAARTEPS